VPFAHWRSEYLEEDPMEPAWAIFRDRSWRIPDPQLTHDTTALLIIDLQYADAHPDYGSVRKWRERASGTVDYYIGRLQTEVIPNTQRLLSAFRSQGLEVIFTRIQELTRDGRDRSREHKTLGILVPRGAREADMLDEVAPASDEIVIDKTCGSPFNGSNIDYVLRNIGIQNLVVCGVVTSGCVEITVRDAADRGYGVVVVRDAVATWTPEMETASLMHMGNSYAKIRTTDEVLSLVDAVREPQGEIGLLG
jgi:nicotinamidase-related amidase